MSQVLAKGEVELVCESVAGVEVVQFGAGVQALQDGVEEAGVANVGQPEHSEL